VNAFWSVTMYDGKTQFLIENPINRYLINSPMLPSMKKNDDGSVTLYIQKDSPGADEESNWLPAPNRLLRFHSCNTSLKLTVAQIRYGIARPCDGFFFLALIYSRFAARSHSRRRGEPVTEGLAEPTFQSMLAHWPSAQIDGLRALAKASRHFGLSREFFRLGRLKGW
jgi:hypothetical protein